MAKIKNPILFSTRFSIPQQSLVDAGLVDPFVNVDVPLFIDPVLLERSRNEAISKNGYERFRAHFGKFIRLLAISKAEGDVAWRAARQHLSLREPPANGLGYGGSGRSGSSRPDEVRETILRTCKEIVELGAADPEMISLMGFFEENVGPDTISDLTTTVVIEDLSGITERFCIDHGIPVFASDISLEHKLPIVVNAKGQAEPIVLVPEDIVRSLPIANDWSEIERAAMENAQIRARVNQLLGRIAKPTIAERKNALRRVALHTSQDFAAFLAAVKANVQYYDPNLDALGYYRLKAILAHGFPGLAQPSPYDLLRGPAEIARAVHDSLSLFKRHVEVGNLWEELWVGSQPKLERASQLIYYAIADAFCKANDIDISPEANMGGGPIDFKFSKGYNARVLVEMKRSSGTVVHGYEKQLEFYKTAAQTDVAIFVVMDYGDLGTKLAKIQRIRADRLNRGERASDIVVIDSRKKASASKRK